MTDMIMVSRSLLESLVAEESCDFDHHSGCQTHNYLSLEPGEICPQAELRGLLGIRGEFEETAERVNLFEEHPQLNGIVVLAAALAHEALLPIQPEANQSQFHDAISAALQNTVPKGEGLWRLFTQIPMLRELGSPGAFADTMEETLRDCVIALLWDAVEFVTDAAHHAGSD